MKSRLNVDVNLAYTLDCAELLGMKSNNEMFCNLRFMEF